MYRLLLLLIFAACSLQAQSADEFIAKSDNYFSNEHDYDKALDMLLEAKRAEPENWEVYWRLARVNIVLGDRVEADNPDMEHDLKLVKYQFAYNYANTAVSLAPEKTVNYIYRGVAARRIGQFQGFISAADIYNDTRDDLLKALEYENGGDRILSIANFELGLTHLMVCETDYALRLPAGLGWGDQETAVEKFQTAIALLPAYIKYYYYLIKAYLLLEQPEEAEAALDEMDKLSVKEPDDWRLKQEAAEMIDIYKRNKIKQDQ